MHGGLSPKNTNYSLDKLCQELFYTTTAVHCVNCMCTVIAMPYIVSMSLDVLISHAEMHGGLSPKNTNYCLD